MLFNTAEQKSAIRREIQGGAGEARCLSAIPRGEGPAESRFKMVNRMTLEAKTSILIWSNCAKAPQVVLAKIYADKKLQDKVAEEREGFRRMLLERSRSAPY